MKKVIFIQLFIVLCVMGMSAQLEVKSSGDTYVAKNIYLGGSASNFLGTTSSNIPITFKVNNVLAGFTGSFQNTNVSFGYGSLPNSLAGTRNTATWSPITF